MTALPGSTPTRRHLDVGRPTTPPGTTHCWDAMRDELAVAATSATGPQIDDRCYRLLAEMKVFHLLLPPAFGGPGLDPVRAMETVEDLATLSGSVGWTSFVGVTGGIFAWELPNDAAREVYEDPDMLVAYAGAPAGILTPNGDDYALTGAWQMASALSHAAWIAVGCRLAASEHSAAPGSAVALVPRADCDVSFTWDPLGLRATGTGTLRINEVRVPGRRIVRDPARDTPGYWQQRKTRLLIPSLMACVSLGLARSAIAEVVSDLAGATGAGPRTIDSDHVQHQVGRLYADVYSARAFLHEVTVDCWRRASRGNDLGLEAGARHRLAATHAATVSADASSAASRILGTRAVTRSHPLCRHWTDARTVAANITVRDLYYAIYGGVALGADIPESWP